MNTTEIMGEKIREALGEEWCMALHGNHDEHQCHKKPGHEKIVKGKEYDEMEQSTVHECYCGVWW